MTREEVLKAIQDLTTFWYDYIGDEHHKDCDCHWYIEKVWSYGEKPKYRARHEGYIFEGTSVICQTEEDAEIALLNLICEALKREKEFCQRVLRNITDYEEEQIKKATQLLKNL